MIDKLLGSFLHDSGLVNKQGSGALEGRGISHLVKETIMCFGRLGDQTALKLHGFELLRFSFVILGYGLVAVYFAWLGCVLLVVPVVPGNPGNHVSRLHQ